MPSIGDWLQFLGGQTFGSTFVPNVDLTGKTIVITGGNSGLGLEAAKHLCRMNLSVLIIGCRDVAKGERAKSQIAEETKCSTTIVIWPIDLSQYASVREFNERLGKLKRLDGFVANAGAENMQFELAEGLEMSLTVNVISTYLTALAALPVLEKTSRDYNTHTNLSLIGSMNRCYAPDAQLDVPEDVDIFTALSDAKTADMQFRYPLTKLILHQTFRDFADIVSARRVKTQNKVVANIVNPGWCYTELGRNKQEVLPERMIKSVIGRTAEQGGRTLVHGVLAGEETHGQYVSECQVKSETSYILSEKGRRVQERLWRDLKRRLVEVDGRVEEILR